MSKTSGMHDITTLSRKTTPKHMHRESVREREGDISRELICAKPLDEDLQESQVCYQQHQS
jgi:hypothetical protein